MPAYNINNGAFQIIQPENEDERIIVDGKLYGDEMHTGWIGGDYDEEKDGLPSWPYENHTVITCTAHYVDGTGQSADIQVGSQVMMEDFGDDGMVEMSVITFELQK